MARLSENAFAVMGVCEETKLPFGITVDLIGPRRYSFVWSFKINREKARREGYDERMVTGAIELDKDYPGCPYCGSKRFYVCRCGKIVCYHGQRIATCPQCGCTGELIEEEELSIKGGGY